MAETLPPDTIAGEIVMRCPWCRQACSETIVTLEAIQVAWERGHMRRALRCDDGTADPCALTADCCTCGRPFIVALDDTPEDGTCLRLVAVRTKADAKLLAGGAA